MLKFQPDWEKIKNNHWFFILPIFLSVVLSFFISPGYGSGIHDQMMYYLPGLLAKIYGPLASGDLSSSFSQGDLSLFNLIIFWLVKITKLNIFVLFFLIAILTRFIYFFAIWRLAGFFTKGAVSRCLSLLLACVPLGVSTSIIENIMIGRTIALPLCLLAFILYLENEKIIASLLLALAFAFHPITCLPFILFFLLDFLWAAFKKRPLSGKALFLLPAALVGVMILVQMPRQASSNFLQTMSGEWYRIVRTEAGIYFFISLWGKALVGLAAMLILFLIFLKTKILNIDSSPRKKIILLFFFIPLILSAFSIIAGDFAKIALVIQLQMGRALNLWTILFIILLPIWFDRLLEKNNNFFLFLFSCAFLIAFLPHYYSAEIIFALLIAAVLWRSGKSGVGRPAENKLFFVIVLLGIFLPLIASQIKGNYHKANWLIPGALIAALLLAWLGKKYPAVAKYLPAIIVIPFLFYQNEIFNFQTNFQGIYPDYEKSAEVKKICAWTEKNTSPQDIFITDDYSDLSTPLRLECRRGIYYSSQEVGQITFSRQYALAREKRKEIIAQAEADPQNAEKILRATGAKYLTSLRPLPFGRLVFQTDKYYIYQLTP